MSAAAERFDASKARRLGNEMRRRAYQRAVSAEVLRPPRIATNVEVAASRQRQEAERVFTPAFYWTGVWTDEARRAYYGLPR